MSGALAPVWTDIKTHGFASSAREIDLSKRSWFVPVHGRPKVDDDV